jgi:Leucine-rich repeat (LRR) protein
LIGDGYVCLISNSSLTKDEMDVVTIGGCHLPGRDSWDVINVHISDSDIPLVVNRIFLAFPNLRSFRMLNSGLQRVQTNAVDVAMDRLEVLGISVNPSLTTINSNAFSGARNLIRLEMVNNAIKHIHENAFAGLFRLEAINLHGNRIHNFQSNFFRHLPRIRNVLLSSNRLTILKESWFSYNNQIIELNAWNNQIKAIERSFLKSMPGIFLLRLNFNVCIDANFVFSITPGEVIAEALEPCFKSFDDADVDLF